jgi:hypothetical protein
MEAPVYHLENVVHVRSELENFDGPLDLILTLLSRNRMEIQDIQISLILDQYLQWMEEQKELNLDVASEFVAMASHLVFIKTKVLLAMDQEESVSEMEELVAALEERKRSENYARVKLLLPELKRRYEIGSDCLTRGPLPVTPDKTYRYHHAPEDLAQADAVLYPALPLCGGVEHHGLEVVQGPGEFGLRGFSLLKFLPQCPELFALVLGQQAVEPLGRPLLPVMGGGLPRRIVGVGVPGVNLHDVVEEHHGQGLQQVDFHPCSPKLTQPVGELPVIL